MEQGSRLDKIRPTLFHKARKEFELIGHDAEQIPGQLHVVLPLGKEQGADPELEGGSRTAVCRAIISS